MTTTGGIARCMRDNRPAYRQVTVTTAAFLPVINGPLCLACIDSVQQDSRYFTATITFGPLLNAALARGEETG